MENTKDLVVTTSGYLVLPVWIIYLFNLVGGNHPTTMNGMTANIIGFHLAP
jgi:hypothetical protein